MCAIVYVYGMPIHYKVKKQDFVRQSSVATELKGLTYAGQLGMYANETVEWLDIEQATMNRNITDMI